MFISHMLGIKLRAVPESYNKEDAHLNTRKP
jgi:hypothetical protein